MVQVIGVHKLPFDSERFERDMQFAVGRPHEAELRAQFRANWDSAWIVVVESDRDIDFGKFAYPRPGPHAQAAWLEQELSRSGDTVRGAFFLHYLDPARSIWYRDQELGLPTVTPPPAALVEMMAYQSPD